MAFLIPFEFKKLLRRQSVFGAIVVVLLAVGGLFYQHFFNGQISGSSADQVHGRAAVAINQQIAEKHTGYLSDDLISRILNDYAKNQSDLKKKGVYSVVSHYAISHLVPKSTDKLIAINSTDKPLTFDNVHLKSREELGSALPLKELKLGNFAPWNQLFDVTNSTYLLVVMLCLYITAPLFSGESSKKMNSILLTTVFGRGKLTLAKLAVSIAISTLVFAIANGLVFAVFATYFGFSGWDTSLQLNLYWIDPVINIMAFPEKMTLGIAFVYLLVFQYIGLIFMTGIHALVSSLTKSPLTTFGISALIVYAPVFLMGIFPEGLMNKLLTFVSVQTFGTQELLLKLAYSGKNGFIFNHFLLNFISITGMRLLLSCLLMTLTFYVIKRKSS
ncbi:ABC transporter permease subunit [Streptococcus equi]|uniref:ABC transporter permease subunit n=1 Tax=Streptococcus equi TaxID=1336 RepID=UPI001981181B|nr:ABC transporter permease subunit [Streptococcus equi]QTZ57022.1 hypothetical protein JFMEOBDD_01104 [Streptococcus equi subsp. zooepidemicus]